MKFDRDIIQLPTQRVRMDRSVEIMVLHRREVSWKKNFISDFRAQTVSVGFYLPPKGSDVKKVRPLFAHLTFKDDDSCRHFAKAVGK